MSEHPAPYSPEVIAAIREHLEPGMHVHDPFAGEGLRLGALCDEMLCTFTGTEIEAPFILDSRVRHGDSTLIKHYPLPPFTIVTSPVYPNGIADDFNARDNSKRRTYRAARATIVGTDEPLHPNNQGKYGYRGQPLWSPARAIYWALARQVVHCWRDADAAIVNVSDFFGPTHREPVVDGWTEILTEQGWDVCPMPVETKRWRNGANRDARVEAEVLLLCSRDPDIGDK